MHTNQIIQYTIDMCFESQIYNSEGADNAEQQPNRHIKSKKFEA